MFTLQPNGARAAIVSGLSRNPIDPPVPVPWSGAIFHPVAPTHTGDMIPQAVLARLRNNPGRFALGMQRWTDLGWRLPPGIIPGGDPRLVPHALGYIPGGDPRLVPHALGYIPGGDPRLTGV